MQITFNKNFNYQWLSKCRYLAVRTWRVTELLRFLDVLRLVQFTALIHFESYCFSHWSKFAHLGKEAHLVRITQVVVGATVRSDNNRVVKKAICAESAKSVSDAQK